MLGVIPCEWNPDGVGALNYTLLSQLLIGGWCGNSPTLRTYSAVFLLYSKQCNYHGFILYILLVGSCWLLSCALVLNTVTSKAAPLYFTIQLVFMIVHIFMIQNVVYYCYGFEYYSFRPLRFHWLLTFIMIGVKYLFVVLRGGGVHLALISSIYCSYLNCNNSAIITVTSYLQSTQ